MHKDGGNINNTKVEKFFKKQRIHYQKKSEEEAKKAIIKGRFLVLSFRLDNKQWQNFNDFYKKNKTGILTEDILNKGCIEDKNPSSHAVILIEVTKNYLRFLNSWGSNWADKGTFKVKTGKILKPYNTKDNPKFYDIAYYEDDLTIEEKNYYANNNEYLRNLLNLYCEMSIESIRNNINRLYHFSYTCDRCKERMVLGQLKKFIKDGLYNIKCPFCQNSCIAKGKLRKLFLFEDLMHDGNKDFDINFKENYSLDIKRIELHKSFENNITNKSDRCTIGSENPLDKTIDSFFINKVNSIICLENGKFIACSSNMILIFELIENKINYLIMKNISSDNLSTLCDLKLDNLIASGGEDLKIFKINYDKHELNLHLRFKNNKKINKIILTNENNDNNNEINKTFAVCDQSGFIGLYKITKNNNIIKFSFIHNIKCHESNINCILYLPHDKILVSGSEKLKSWEIQDNNLDINLNLLEEILGNNLVLYNNSLLNMNKHLLVGEKDGIEVYFIENKRFFFSFFYKNEEFGNVYTINPLGNNYFICGRSFGFCSIFLLREEEGKGKSIRKINIFRNNNLRTSDEAFEVTKDNYYINNICIKKTSVATGNILVSSVDKTLKVYSFSFINNALIN